jgi:hypothetical protein
MNMKKLIAARLIVFSILCLIAIFSLLSCSEDTEKTETDEQEQTLTAAISDGLYENWNAGDKIALIHNGQTSVVEALESGSESDFSGSASGTLSDDNPLYAVFPAEALASSELESVSITIPDVQTDGGDGFDIKSVGMAARTTSNSMNFRTICGGIKLNFQMSGVTKVELECVDGYALSGTVKLKWDEEGTPSVDAKSDTSYIITFSAPDNSSFTPGKDYYISTLPCDIYGGYRLSIYKDGLVANYFGVHQTVDRASYIAPIDLVESELEFDDPDAPLIEEERPELDATTTALLRQYKINPTEENKQALLEQMGIRYDKVVARKKSKLRELEREAKTPDLVEEMQAIVDEMVENREVRLEQQFLRLIDPRTDDNPDDAWMVLRGASAPDAYIGYAPVTNAEYAAFKTDFSYEAGTENYPVTNVSIDEAEAYCDWLTTQDSLHKYRLPTDEEWILGAGHMPKDVTMNSDHVESGLTSVYAYSQTTGACGGIDFWGNCWEWTSSTDGNGLYIIKGGSWDSSRDDCRTEKSDVVREGSRGYANVGFRVVRTSSDS